MNTGYSAEPVIVRFLVMVTSLSAIPLMNAAFSSITELCITILFLITAPFPTFTPRNRTEFSTVPSIMQPSAIREFFTFAPIANFAGGLSLTLV